MGIVKAFFFAVTAKIAAEEARAWLPSISEHLLNIAVMRLPEEERARYSEEWAADLESYPGALSKCVRAIGLVFASLRMNAFLFESVHSIGKSLAPFLHRHRYFSFSVLYNALGAEFLVWTSKDPTPSFLRLFLALVVGSVVTYVAMFYYGRWVGRRNQMKQSRAGGK